MGMVGGGEVRSEGGEGSREEEGEGEDIQLFPPRAPGAAYSSASAAFTRTSLLLEACPRMILHLRRGTRLAFPSLISRVLIPPSACTRGSGATAGDAVGRLL